MAALYSIQMFEWRIYFKILFHLRCTPYDVGERRYVVCSSVCSNWHAVSGAVCSGQDAEIYIYIFIYIILYIYIYYLYYIYSWHAVSGAVCRGQDAETFI